MLGLIERGHTNGEIADQLGISVQGVKWHVTEILTKLGAPSREDAAEYARTRAGTRIAFRRIGRMFTAAIGLKLAAAATGLATVVGVVATAGPPYFRPAFDSDPLPPAEITAAATLAETFDIRDRASVYQLSLIADGVVDEHEYVAAMEATVACLRQRGWTVAERGLQGPYRRFEYVYWEDEAVRSGGLQTDPSCEDEFSQVVSMLWAQQQQGRPDVAAVESASEDAMDKCLNASEAPPAAGTEEFAVRAVRVRALFGVAIYRGTEHHVDGLDDPGSAEDESVPWARSPVTLAP